MTEFPPGSPEQDFERLFEETAPMIYNLGLRLFHDEEDAMDFSQEVYLQAYDKLRSFRGDAKFSTWLYSLGLHWGLNKIRRQKKWRLLSVDEPGPDGRALELEASPREDPFLILSENEQAREVQIALDALPDAYRLPLVLYYYEKLAYEQIARELGIKEGTIKSNIFRGKAMLRDILLKKGFEK